MLNWVTVRHSFVPGAPLTVSYRQPGVVLTDHRFTVPLDHDDPTVGEGDGALPDALDVGDGDAVDPHAAPPRVSR